MNHRYATVDGVRMHYVVAGSGDAIVLVHGFLGTWYQWREIIPSLAESYTVIAPDLRGFGDSMRTATGYDKRTVGEDVYKLVTRELGIERFHLVGHDLGAMATYTMAADHPETVRSLAFLDAVVPGDGGGQSTEISQGGHRWHLSFSQTPDLPEALVQDREHLYLGYFWRNYGHTAAWLTPEVEAEYLRTYRRPGTMHAGFELYRTLPEDAAVNAEISARFKLPMPVLAVGGATSKGRGTSVAASLRNVATDVRECVIADCGHFIPEERPDVFLAELHTFLQSVP